MELSCFEKLLKTNFPGLERDILDTNCAACIFMSLILAKNVAATADS